MSPAGHGTHAYPCAMRNCTVAHLSPWYLVEQPAHAVPCRVGDSSVHVQATTPFRLVSPNHSCGGAGPFELGYDTVAPQPVSGRDRTVSLALRPK